MGEKKNANGDGGNKKVDSTIAVFKVDMHCEGCANKLRKSVREIEGVQRVRADWEANKLTVIGKFDPSKLREEIGNKTSKKVEVVSAENKKDKDAKSDKKPNEKKAKDKEIPATTATLKVELHCQGCIEKIYKVASKTKGVEDISIDREKDLVMVKGKMDLKALIENLEEKLKRKVGIVEPKKEKEDGAKKEKEDGAAKNNGSGGVMDGNRLDYMAFPVYGNGYGYGYGYGHGGEQVPSPQIFSDENPNACSVM